MYGRDLANSRSVGRAGPSPTAARHLRQLWRFDAAGGITGTPAVVGGTLVAGTYGNGSTGNVFALDIATGQPRWIHHVPDGSVNGSVSVADGRVYVPLYRYKSRPRLIALDLRDGTELWDSTLDSQPGADVYGSPVPWRERVYIGVSAGDAEHFIPRPETRGSVVALDARTGRRIWKTYTAPPGFNGAAVWSTPAIDARRQRLYVGTGNAFHAPQARTIDSVLALDTRNGHILRHFQATANDRFTDERGGPGPDVDFGASPNLFRSHGRALVGELQKNNVYWALDRATMKLAWTTHVGTRGPDEDALASTAYDGHAIYGQTIDGQVWALRPDGRRLWTTRSDGNSNNSSYSPLAVGNGVVYNLSAAGFLNARSTATGRLLRRAALGAKAWGGMAIAGTAVYVVTGTNKSPVGSVIAFG